MGCLDRVQYWNVTPDERRRDHPADLHLGAEGATSAPADHMVRALDVDADPDVVFRWLCQLRVAPYSYDLIDNFGRRSPRTLTPGAEQLAIGQRFDVIARIVGFVPGEQITAATADSRLSPFGAAALSYQVTPGVRARSRILACMAVPARTALARGARAALAAGDLVMMRKQLLTLRELAEGRAR